VTVVWEMEYLEAILHVLIPAFKSSMILDEMVAVHLVIVVD